MRFGPYILLRIYFQISDSKPVTGGHFKVLGVRIVVFHPVDVRWITGLDSTDSRQARITDCFEKHDYSSDSIQ